MCTASQKPLERQGVDASVAVVVQECDRLSGTESAINHLEHCGLDRVRDHGRGIFARAVALSVPATNLK